LVKKMKQMYRCGYCGELVRDVEVIKRNEEGEEWLERVKENCPNCGSHRLQPVNFSQCTVPQVEICRWIGQ